jgi:hypothetical protein
MNFHDIMTLQPLIHSGAGYQSARMCTLHQGETDAFNFSLKANKPETVNPVLQG